MQNNTILSRIFDVCNYVFLLLYGLLCFFPFLYIVSASFADSSEIISRSIFLIPHSPTVAAYEYIISSPVLPRSLLVSICVTVAGTIVSMAVTMSMAYAVSKQYLVGRKIIMGFVTFTLVFSGGMIPTFLVVKMLGLIDHFAALILPVCVNTFNLIVIKNFFQRLPQELEDAARIDGCNDMRIFTNIVLPLSMPVIATFTLMYAVGYWNDYFNSLIYLNNTKKWPLQIMLRQIVMFSQGGIDGATVDEAYVKPPAQSIKMAVIVFGTAPILAVYPFLQKHFAKGVLLGSVKG
ncbi:MAG TPA: carbohydrate ABC transporter permease [Candidatus Limiplasma sp.]|nr:carbohydrate ABC transporter permease [Candidatus Limiplasma sp.]